MFRTIPPPPNRLLVFARLPELGRVKTRLAAQIGNERALAVYEAMLRDALRSITEGPGDRGTEGPENDDLEIEVLWAPTENANGEFLRRAFGTLNTSMQSGRDLTDRMAMAFSERFFFHRTQKIVAIGVDDPLIPRRVIDDAFQLLESCEWVVGPASDGGYYLIGCRGPSFDNEIFQNIEWGTGSVCADTLARIREWQHSVALLPERSDIDDADDLRTFAASETDGALAELLREWEWR